MIFFKHFVIPLIICIGVGLGFILGWRLWYVDKLQQQQFQSTGVTFVPDQPSAARSLTITDIIGASLKQNREGDWIPLVTGSLLLQGETIHNDATSAAYLSIPMIGTLNVGNNTALSPVDLIPEKLTLSQEKGEVIYTASNPDLPITVRALHSLIKIASGSAKVDVNTITNRIIFSEVTGLVTFAYQDKNHNTYVETIATDKPVTYDDNRRAMVKPTPIPVKTIKRKK